MGNDDDAEYVDTDWSGRPVARRPLPIGPPRNLKLVDGHLLIRRKDGKWYPATDLVTPRSRSTPIIRSRRASAPRRGHRPCTATAALLTPIRPANRA